MLTGLIYFHDITAARVGKVSARVMRSFEGLCGGHALHNVVLCTTKWDIARGEWAEAREAELRTGFWKEMLAKGAVIRRHSNNRESAEIILRYLIEKPPTTFLLQTELEQVKDPLKTTAGRELAEDDCEDVCEVV